MKMENQFKLIPQSIRQIGSQKFIKLQCFHQQLNILNRFLQKLYFLYLQTLMLPTEKNQQIISKMTQALQRLDNLALCKQTFFNYLLKINTLEKTYAKKIWNSMTELEDKIVKLTFYSSQKVKRIHNFTKTFKQFSYQWERISKANIRIIQQIDNKQFQSMQKIVKQKSNNFLQQIQTNINQQKHYNDIYLTYQALCADLKDSIDRFKTYSDPLRFYNQKFTNQFLQKLKKQYDKCTYHQSGEIKTQAQMCDHQRLCIDSSRVDVKQAYVSAFQKILKSLYVGIKLIIDPNKDQAIQKDNFKLKKNQAEEKQFYKGQVQNLLGTQSYGNREGDQTDNIQDDFKQLFQNNEIDKAQITPDQKFFYDRCQNVKNKKIQRSNEILGIQKLLINELKAQVISLKRFQTESKKIEKQIFGSDGSQTYSKKFRKYFGKNFYQLYELCTLISQKRKTSLQKIYKTIENFEQKLESPFKQKKQKLKFFTNRTSYMLQNLKKVKQKAQLNNFISQQIVKQYKLNVSSTFEDFSRNYDELVIHQVQMDNIFFKNLQQISSLILNQAITKSLTKILEKQKNRVQIFRQLNIPTEAQSNFYEDSKYQIFFSKQLQPNLSKSFKSQINTKEFQQTKITLTEKQHALNGMIEHKTSCCGIKSQVKMENIKQSFQCYLINKKKQKSKIYGSLNILLNGITFSQKSFIPFAKVLQIILPSRDIDNYKTEVVDQTKVLTINTKKGPVYFWSDEVEKIFKVIQGTQGFRTIQKESNDKKQRSGSFSSSFLGTSISQSFRAHYQKTTDQTTKKLKSRRKRLSQEEQLKSKRTSQRSSQFTDTQLLKRIQVKLMSTQFLGQNFAQIQKQQPKKDPSRFDYNYHQGIHKFLLKQKKRFELNDKILAFDYQWKVAFPKNVMLKSFTHYETIYIEIQKALTKIKIIHGANDKSISLAQKIFYQQISSMNGTIIETIKNLTERQCEVTIQLDKEEDRESQFNIDPQDIQVNVNYQGEGKLLATNTEGFIRNPKFQKSLSGFSVISGKS